MKSSKLSLNQIIKEEFNKFILKEFMQPSFNWDTFKSKQYPKDRCAYCEKHLGTRIGAGSARVVFDYDDEKVLKVSRGFNNEQNEQEVEVCQKANNPLLPKIFDYDKYDYTWILTERVLGANEEDFERILGVPFYEPELRFKNKKKNDDKVGFDEYQSEEPLDNRWKNPSSTKWEEFENDDYSISMDGFLSWYQDYKGGWHFDEDDIENKTYLTWLENPWIKNLIELFKFQEPYEFRLENFGIAIRDGKPCIVVLDIGWQY